jgi:ATP-dependent RNA helicase DeaD
MTTFTDLGIKNDLISGIRDLGFENPMPIQKEVIPTLLKKEGDIIGLAQTGTGKTAAFGLPILQDTDISKKSTQAVVLAPTRELCLQIAADLKTYAKYLNGLNIVTVYGGADIERQLRAIKKGAHIIVGTPGRMNDLLNRRKVIDISQINTLVLDEADEMLSMGFKDELEAILGQTPNSKNTLLFSATMPGEMMEISKKYLDQPREISIGERNTGAENVTHIAYMVHEKDRYLALKRIVDFNPEIYGIIFCRTREQTKEVAKKLIHDSYNVDALHGDLSQAQREAIMHKFRIKNLHLLTATDVAARGLDVKKLTHIINYNLPDEDMVYIHRSGRTGRAGKTGISIAITNLREKNKIRKIESLLNKKFEMKPVPGSKEICEMQLFHLIDRMQNIEIEHQEIDNFLPGIYEKLAGFNREDLIKQFVALEFNRFLAYYKNAKELRKPQNQTRKANKKSAPRREKKKPKNQRFFPETGFTRFYINLGEKDHMTPGDLIGLIYKSTRKRNIHIGRIDILRKFSFFEVDEHFTIEVLRGFNQTNYKKKEIIVEISRDFNELEISPVIANRRHRKNGKKGKTSARTSQNPKN